MATHPLDGFIIFGKNEQPLFLNLILLMILIVDDKQENLFSLTRLLQLHGYDVDNATSGEEALKKVLRKEYVLIILDVQMPGMDGYEVAEIVKGYSKTKNVPIIFLSAVNVDKRFVTKGYASGGVDYITKPFDADILLLRVQTFYKLHEQTIELHQMQEALKAANLSLEDKVTERTKALLEINKDLEESNAELQQFAYVASHDLQEPLRKITTFSHIIEEKFLADNKDAAVYLNKINASTVRMRTLINDLLNYSRISIDGLFERTDINDILKEVITDLELAIGEQQAIVTVDDIGFAEVIPGQIRQIFQNIIGNALKFAKKNEVPVVRIWGERVDELSQNATLTPGGKYLRICICDNGIGFNLDYLEKIFTLFQRLHVGSAYEGTGIGLAIVKKIVDKHNGMVTAKSEEGKGATFIIIIPVTQLPKLAAATHTRLT